MNEDAEVAREVDELSTSMYGLLHAPRPTLDEERDRLMAFLRKNPSVKSVVADPANPSQLIVEHYSAKPVVRMTLFKDGLVSVTPASEGS